MRQLPTPNVQSPTPKQSAWELGVGSWELGLLLEDVSDRRIQLLSRLVPALFEVLFPVLRPGTAVVIDEARVRRRRLLGPAIGVEDVAQALDEGVPAIWIVSR